MTYEMVAVLPGDTTAEKIKKIYLEKAKPILLAAIKAGGGSLLVRINVPAIDCHTMAGGSLVLQGDVDGSGDGKIHEITAPLLDAEGFSPEFGSEVADHLEKKEYYKKHPEIPKKFNQGFLAGSSTLKVNMIDVFTPLEYAEAMKRERSVSSFPGVAPAT